MKRTLRASAVVVCAVAACLFLACRAGAGDDTAATAPTPEPVAGTGQACVYWQEILQAPRPLHIHVLKIDLQAPAVRVEARVAPDPDGAGPAEAELTQPEKLAAEAGVIAAVNANAFAGLPDKNGETSHDWHNKMPVDILGWACHQGQNRSAAAPGACNLWIDEQNRPFISRTAPKAGAREALAGFQPLMIDGKRIDTKDDGVLHPRTIAGVDKEHRYLWLAVIDGRQKRYSEGMSSFELGNLAERLGCWDALNFDGGGSTIMLKLGPDGKLAVANRPSGFTSRPVPTMLLIRTTTPPATGGKP